MTRCWPPTPPSPTIRREPGAAKDKSTERIDGIVALIMLGMAASLAQDPAGKRQAGSPRVVRSSSNLPCSAHGVAIPRGSGRAASPVWPVGWTLPPALLSSVGIGRTPPGR